MALTGATPRDNIPGVRCVGEKPAQRLFSDYGSLDNIYAHLAEIKGKLKRTLKENRRDGL
jgi:DNA polymerase-1